MGIEKLKENIRNRTQAILISPDGTTRNIDPKNGKDFDLGEMQEYVGGYIELVTCSDGRVMIVNEEGILLRMQANKVASQLASPHLIFGPVVVCPSTMVK